MKIAIDLGHNCRGDRGAVGIKKEDDLIFEVGNKLIRLLEREGHEVINVTPKSATSVINSLSQRVLTANKHRCDLFVSLHFNAFNSLAFGTEVYALESRAKTIGARIGIEIGKLGFFNRGVKSRNFYVIKHTKMPAVLVECCFCDSRKDMALYDPVLMAIAIKNGIVGKKGIYNPTPKTNYLSVKEPTWIKQTTEQAAILGDRDKIRIEPGLYTICDREPVEESHFWVELKSGISGFVYCDHVTTVVK